MIRRLSIVLAWWLLLVSLRAALAEVTRIEITKREPFQDGKSFGEAGPYVRLRGKVHFAVDPDHAANRQIIDLQLAPQHKNGVHFSADFEMLAPQDLRKANGTLLYDVNNRGNRIALAMFNRGGNDFLMRKGFIVVWSGWIAELLPGGQRLRLFAPVATRDGQTIKGLVRAEMAPDKPAQRLPIAHWTNHGSYPPTEKGRREATLTWRLNERDPRVPIPRAQWRLEETWVEADGERAALPKIELILSGGFRPGYLYELIYEAQGPIVQGVGLAGIRDWVSFLKYDSSDRNPLLLENQSAARDAIGFGVSQSGRCLRMLLYDGFNADEKGRQVFDGVMPHVAGGGLGYFNHRFASPTRYNAQHDNHLYPADVFPFTYGDEQDPFSGRTDGILRRARQSDAVPKIMHTQSSSEYWHRSGSLVHTDPLGQRDAEIPAEVRIYSFGGTQHGPGGGIPRAGGNGQLPANPNDYRPFLRGLLTALQAWIREGTEPPPSVYPRIASGTAVDWQQDASGWRPLPGIRYPEIIQQPPFTDRGPDFLTRRITTVQPPQVLKHYRVKVPAYGADNNEQGVLLLPSVAVPVATYTSWNLRRPEIGAQRELLSLRGGYIPFAPSKADRLRSGDPRPSLLERYRDYEDYQARYRQAARQLVQDRYVLEEELDRIAKPAAWVKKQFEEAGPAPAR